LRSRQEEGEIKMLPHRVLKFRRGVYPKRELAGGKRQKKKQDLTGE